MAKAFSDYLRVFLETYGVVVLETELGSEQAEAICKDPEDAPILAAVCKVLF
ncbi:hypothetical protein BH24DEI2_BH24DEI2_02740 [soil metagenome]